MVVQLAALAFLTRLAGVRYLLASGIAVELAVLHNFVWYVHFTWRDRRARQALAAQLARFHLSNGAVSLAGNLVLMRLLVQQMRFPVLVANGIAIVCCSAVNFSLSNVWAFASAPTQSGSNDANRAGEVDPAQASAMMAAPQSSKQELPYGCKQPELQWQRPRPD